MVGYKVLKNTINNDKFSLTVNILVKKEQGVLVGHCLELDIVATANNMRQLKKDMAGLIIAQIDYAFTNNNLSHLFHSAPSEIWEEFYKCKKHAETKIKLTSKLQKNKSLKTFVPPWIIAKTCMMENACVV